MADGYPGLVPIRDSKAPTGPALLVAASAWATLVESAAERRPSPPYTAGPAPQP